MFASKVNIPLFSIRTTLNKSVMCCHFLNYHGRIDTVAKRASMLKNLIENKDRRKNWHFNIIPSKPKVRIFDKIHKPHRRRAVLSSLFITNITDVLSTGDIIPDIGNYGIEITGVQVSPCYKILNVFWQVPVSHFDSCQDIDKLLFAAAPKIRAELISRNVLGRVPMLYFLRDSTNARVASFEQAMKQLDLEPKTESGVIIDDSFIKDVYSFNEAKVIKNENLEASEEKKSVPDEEESKEDMTTVPYKPVDMKCDVCGLDHDLLMAKVIAMKKKKKDPPQHTAVISPENLKDADDLFCKIPGVCFQTKSSNQAESRDAILKKFHIERKMLKEKAKAAHIVDYNHENYDTEDDDDSELNSFGDDFIEDETTDNS